MGWMPVVLAILAVPGTIGAILSGWWVFKARQALTKVEAAKVNVEDRATSLQGWITYATTLEGRLSHVEEQLSACQERDAAKDDKIRKLQDDVWRLQNGFEPRKN
jgi:hypothetical protein